MCLRAPTRATTTFSFSRYVRSFPNSVPFLLLSASFCYFSGFSIPATHLLTIKWLPSSQSSPEQSCGVFVLTVSRHLRGMFVLKIFHTQCRCWTTIEVRKSLRAPYFVLVQLSKSTVAGFLLRKESPGHRQSSFNRRQALPY